jgi:hypothetical protein
MKTLNSSNSFFIIPLLGGVALIATGIVCKAYIHVLFGAGALLLAAAWRKESRKI